MSPSKGWYELSINEFFIKKKFRNAKILFCLQTRYFKFRILRSIIITIQWNNKDLLLTKQILWKYNVVQNKGMYKSTHQFSQIYFVADIFFHVPKRTQFSRATNMFDKTWYKACTCIRVYLASFIGIYPIRKTTP